MNRYFACNDDNVGFGSTPQEAFENLQQLDTYARLESTDFYDAQEIEVVLSVKPVIKVKESSK